MLSVTPTAVAKLSEILDRQPSAPRQVRVSVIRGPHGCVHGWNLGIEAAQADDTVLDFERLQVLVDSQLTERLEGATIDYREDGGMIGFAIEVPGGSSPEGHHGCHH